MRQYQTVEKQTTEAIRIFCDCCGKEIKKEKVTPSGNPALVKPINNGIEEHEQNGVTVPNNADMIFAPIP